MAVVIRPLCHSYFVDNVVLGVSPCGESLTDEEGLGERLLERWVLLEANLCAHRV